MIRSLSILITLLLGTSCQAPPPAPPTLPAAPIVELAPAIQRLFAAYQKEPVGALFFVSRDGRQGVYFYCLFHPCDEVREEELRQRCFMAGISDCLTYARGPVIVAQSTRQTE